LETATPGPVKSQEKTTTLKIPKQIQHYQKLARCKHAVNKSGRKGAKRRAKRKKCGFKTASGKNRSANPVEKQNQGRIEPT